DIWLPVDRSISHLGKVWALIQSAAFGRSVSGQPRRVAGASSAQVHHLPTVSLSHLAGPFFCPLRVRVADEPRHGPVFRRHRLRGEWLRVAPEGEPDQAGSDRHQADYPDGLENDAAVVQLKDYRVLLAIHRPSTVGFTVLRDRLTRRGDPLKLGPRCAEL